MARKNTHTITKLEEIYELLQKEHIDPSYNVSFSHPKKTKNRSINMSLGRVWFNLILPDNYAKLIDEPVNKKLANSILSEIAEKFSAEEAAAALTKISKEIFKICSINPVSFSSKGMILPPEIQKMKEERLSKDTSPEDFGKILKEIAEEYVKNYLNDEGIRNIIESNSSISIIEWAVLMVAKGPTLNIEDEISKPITSSLADGYTGEEFYDAASEARRMYYIRSVGTSEPGYLARQVTFANANSTLTSDDCGTKKYLSLFIRESILPTIQGRYYLDELEGKLVKITKTSKITNKTILLRSPLYCKDKKGICKTCYGELSNKIQSKHIGIIAGTVINDSGIEGYAMKARHQATQVNLKPVDFTQDLIHI